MRLPICSAALALLLAFCILPGERTSSVSRYSLRVEEDLCSLGMERLNCTMEESFALNREDTIDVHVVCVSGELKISIGQKDREPIYEGRNPELGAFRVTVPEDGDCFLSVTGKRAEGSISFQISRSENEALSADGANIKKPLTLTSRHRVSCAHVRT